MLGEIEIVLPWRQLANLGEWVGWLVVKRYKIDLIGRYLNNVQEVCSSNWTFVSKFVLEEQPWASLLQ